MQRKEVAVTKERRASTGRRSVDDPRLSRGARRLLRAALAEFAKSNPHPLLGPDEHLAAVIELYEHGFLQIEKVNDGIVVSFA
jgi:hypothetical protein